MGLSGSTPKQMMVQVEINEKIYKTVNTTLNMVCHELVTAFTHALE